MAFSELEERISKIRQQNEEIKRRYEEVEEDKKNAAKSNALVQMVPSTIWPERKEPPEYSNPPKVNHKPKSVMKEQSEHIQQHHPNERRKGEGPPPDPKYNFLADAEREEYSVPNNQRDTTGNKNHNRSTRGNFKKRGMGKEGQQKGRTYHGTHRDEHKPEYEAWRKERNRIDEDRISRQKTAEGNWRREWDNDKAHLVNEISKGEGKVTLGDFSKKDGRYSDNSGYANHNRGGYHKSHRGSPRNFHNNHDYMNLYDFSNLDMSSMPIPVDERTVVATDKSIKVTLNQSNMTKGPVMSVKVNSPSIAGTGRVGPRQRTRVTYSSHSDMDTNNAFETGSFSRQKSFEDKTKGNHYNNVQRTPSLRRPQSQKKKENGAKSPFSQRKEFRKETSFANSSKHYENGSQPNFVRKEYKDSQKFHYPPKSPRTLHKSMKIPKDNSVDVTNDNTIKDEQKEVAEDNDASIESEKVNIESPNEMNDQTNDECSIENESKNDFEEENNEIIFENSECSPCEEETTNENVEDFNQDDINVVSANNLDTVNISEDKQEGTNANNSVISSQMQDINTNEENNINDEKIETDNLTTIINNATMDSCNSDNNTTSTLDITQVEDTKTDELIEDNVSNMTNDEKSKESPKRDDSSQSNDQNDIAAMNSEKVSDIIIETYSKETLHSPVDKSVIAPEKNDVTHHNNKVPIEKNELSINNINDQSTTENTECTSSICIDKVSGPVDIAKDSDITSEEIVEKNELQCKTIESVVEEKRVEIEEVTQANSEN